MIAADSSVVIAAAVGPPPQRAAARQELEAKPRIVFHAALEAYSVLTRLPAPYRMTAADARAFVRQSCPGEPLRLARAPAAAFLDRLAERAILGGAVYDALIGATAAAAGVRLLSLDTRATGTYTLMGADVELITL